MQYVIINSSLTEADKAVISVQDRGFRFGDGVFETLRVHRGVPYRLEWHLSRLAGGLSALRIAFDAAGLADACRLLVARNGVTEGALRVQVTRGIGSRGYLPDPGHPQAGATCVIETMALPDPPPQPVTLWRSSLQKTPARALPVHYKLCQGLNSTLARMEAQEHDCFEALLFNERGDICETAAGNIFWLDDGTLCTPALSCGVLQGATRDTLLRLSPMPVREVSAGMEALQRAQAVVITNSLWPVLAVSSLQPGGMTWESGALAAQLASLITGDMEAYCKSA